MQRITAVNPDEATGKTKDLLDGVKAKVGFVPNMMTTMASSPAVLEAYLNFSGSLGSTLNAKLREQIALTTAEINGCQYCASAHSAIGKMSGLDESAIVNARRAFTIEDLPREVLRDGIEIGRACIAREHRNTKVLFLLWKALLAYLEQSGKRYFFGC